MRRKRTQRFRDKVFNCYWEYRERNDTVPLLRRWSGLIVGLATTVTLAVIVAILSNKPLPTTWTLYRACAPVLIASPFLEVGVGMLYAWFRQPPCVEYPSWPVLWRLIGFVFPRKIRLGIYEPGRQDLLQDYLEARQLSKSKLSRYFLRLCLAWHTCLLFLGCVRALCSDKFVGWLLRIISRG